MKHKILFPIIILLCVASHETDHLYLRRQIHAAVLAQRDAMDAQHVAFEITDRIKAIARDCAEKEAREFIAGVQCSMCATLLEINRRMQDTNHLPGIFELDEQRVFESSLKYRNEFFPELNKMSAANSTQTNFISTNMLSTNAVTL